MTHGAANDDKLHRIGASTYDTKALQLDFLKGCRVSNWDSPYSDELLVKYWPERFKDPTGMQPLDYS